MMQVKNDKSGHGQKRAQSIKFARWVESGIEIRKTQYPHCPSCKEKKSGEQ
jgi:hypothetical protein